MADYGHELKFGTFITPTNANPQVPVALAQFSEQLGFDLVTFQDHPYQPGFLDTWTLLSWVAAQTERVQLSGNVLNLPLRQPAVLARAAASLDLLSEGRFEMGLGAGGFWDPIVAMGQQRLTPGQSVQALEEAIEIIRGIWAAEDRSVLRVPGEFHKVDGAKRGPRPAHPIPIILGALKPRMLRLIGRKADGWLPSMAYLKPGDLQRGNQTIDEAATAAGRHPSEIRRYLNIGGTFTDRAAGTLQGPPSLWVSQLTELAVTDGVATFILGSDDPNQLQRFAEEVMPAVKEAVASERSRSGTAAPTRSHAALAARRPGIDYDSVPAELASNAVEPGDYNYPLVQNTYLRGGEPGLVLRPHNTAQVQAALAFARSQEVLLSLRSGGHGISGRSTNDGGIVIDLGAMNSIEIVDQASGIVRIGPGARWKQVAAVLGEAGFALTSGDFGGVAVGGLATAGGVGMFARKYGLTIDHLQEVELVSADGRVVRASRFENPDLFWGMRGAGANFGIATSFTFKVPQVGDVGFAQLSFAVDDVAGFLQRWGSLVEASPRDLTAQVLLGRPQQGQQYASTMILVDSDDPDDVMELLNPFATLGPLVGQQAQITSYAAIMANAPDMIHAGQGEPVSRSVLVDHLDAEVARISADLVNTGATYFFQIRAVGGAVADVSAADTAYVNRSANFSISAFGSSAGRIDPLWQQLREESVGLYLSFESDPHPDRLVEAFGEAGLARLRELKAKWDPKNVFRDNFNVG